MLAPLSGSSLLLGSTLSMFLDFRRRHRCVPKIGFSASTYIDISSVSFACMFMTFLLTCLSFLLTFVVERQEEEGVGGVDLLNLNDANMKGEETSHVAQAIINM